MFFHSLVYRHNPVPVPYSWSLSEWPRAFIDMSEEELRVQIVEPFRTRRKIAFRSIVINDDELCHVTITESERPSTSPDAHTLFDDTAGEMGRFVYGVGRQPFDVWFAAHGRDVTSRYLSDTERACPKAKRKDSQLLSVADPTTLRVFLCHASEDKSAIRNLCDRLREDGVEPWLDEQQLLAGQDWQYEIAQAVATSDAVLVCLSRSAARKTGFVQREISRAIDLATERPEGCVYVIPVRLEECKVPERLSRWHRVDLFRADGYERLLRGLRHLQKSPT